MTRWFEDIIVGEVIPLGDHTFTQDDIIEFAKEYDPQYFHIDPEQAPRSHFEGLIASGWHTACIGHRKTVDALFAEEARLTQIGETPGVSGPSPGINRMDFKAPVRPGDVITYTLTVTSKRPSNSLPGWGLLINQLEATNADGEQVYIAELVGFTKLRDHTPSLKERLMVWAMKNPILKPFLKR
jgi:acyl dehydratase